jgi:hypothetical protein
MPVLPVQLKDGTKREVWCTFGPEQIDIDINSAAGVCSILVAKRCVSGALASRHAGVELS